MAKLNKDGLEGGKLVSAADHAKVLRKNQLAAQAEKRKAAEKIVNPTPDEK